MKLQRLLRTVVTVSLSSIAVAVIATSAMQAGQTFTVLHNFTYGVDGGMPMAGVTIDAAGNLYGTTFFGGMQACGGGSVCSVVWEITP